MDDHTTGNLFLDRLPFEVRSLLLEKAKQFSINDSVGGERRVDWSNYCIFLTKRFAVETVSVDGTDPYEVYMYGPDDIIGSGRLLWLDNQIQPTILVRGDGLAISLRSVERIVRESTTFRAEIDRYLSIHLRIAAQISGCGARHDTKSRIARWLLMASDRALSSSVSITQEELAGLISARRTSVSLASQPWVKKGIIKQRRGLVDILNRPALEAEACECYHVCKGAIARLRESESTLASAH